MYRDGKQLASTLLHNFVLNQGALGDIITSLPAIIFARGFYGPEVKMRVWVPPWQMELHAHLLAPYGEFEVKNFSDFPMKAVERKGWDGGTVSVNQMAHNTHTRNRVHMVDFAFGCLLDAKPETMAQRNYPGRAPLGERKGVPDRYVVFPVGATSDNKLFKASVMAPILEWCLDNEYAPVLVGTKTNHTQAQAEGKLRPIIMREETQMLSPDLFRQCLDLRETTTLLELRALLGHANAVVGVDGGTLHLAGTTDVPIIYAMGTTLPKHRYIARNGDPSHKIRYVVPRDLECTGCQSNWVLNHIDFRECAYGDSKCMDMLHPDDFVAGLKELGL